MLPFAPECFFWPSFCRSFPWSQHCRISENAHWGSLGKFDIARLQGHFGSRGLQQNLVLGWHLKEMQIGTWWQSRQGVFSGLLFAGVFPGRNIAEFQKTRAKGPLGKFDIARLHGHFGSRGLQQNVVLGWQFKAILTRTWWLSRQGVFLAFFWRGFPWSQLCRISENSRWGSPWRHSSASRALWKPRFPAKCCARLALYGNYN